VSVNLVALHRNPRHWPEPLTWCGGGGAAWQHGSRNSTSDGVELSTVSCIHAATYCLVIFLCLPYLQLYLLLVLFTK
jgi:hypothetical protein